jgi:hypothetical protein
MFNLEELTLAIFVQEREFIDGTYINNDILVYMPRINMFKFWICTDNIIHNSIDHLSKDEIQRTFTNIIFQQVECMINYSHWFSQCYVFSLPFMFNFFIDIGNTFPTIIFNYVRILRVQDNVPFEHDFFIRLAWSFPLLQQLTIKNVKPQSSLLDQLGSNDNQLYSIINYPYLISLCFERAHNDYVEQFLNDTKTYLPRLTKLIIKYNQLQLVTENFTKERTRLNCININELHFMMETIKLSKDCYVYFPSL